MFDFIKNQTGESLGSTAGMLNQFAPEPEMDPRQAALAQLENLIGQQLAGNSQESLQAALDQAVGGIRKAYGAQIGTIRHQNAGARADTEKGRKKILAMYKALGKSYERTGRKEVQQGDMLADKMANLGAGRITQDAQGMLAANAAAGQNLGSPELTAELNSAVNADVGRQNLAAQQYASAEGQRALADTGVTSRYMNSQGRNVNLEGTNRAADLIGQLQDYLQGNRDKIAEIAGQRAQAVAAAKAELGSQFAASQQSSIGDAIDNYFQLYGLAFPEQEQQSAENPLAGLMPDQLGLPAQILGMADQAAPGTNELFNRLFMGNSEDILGIRDGSVGEVPGDGEDNDLDLQDNMSNILMFLSQNPEAQTLPPQIQSMLAAAIWQRLHGAPSTPMENKGYYDVGVR
jgi:hypothetical protein